MANPVGRPRVYDRLKILQDFVAWAQDNPDAIIVPQYTAPLGITSDTLWEWSKKDEELSGLYNVGKEFIGINRLNATRADTLHQSIYHRGTGHYERDLRVYEREQQAYDAQLKAQQMEAVTEEQKAGLIKMFDMLNSQSSPNIDDKSKINETKS